MTTTNTADRRPYVQEMVMVHRVFRRELRLLPQLIHGVRPTDTRRVALLAEALDDLLHGLHVHHEGEDELLWPKLRARVTLAAEYVARMQTQHEQVQRQVEVVTPLLAQWRQAGDSTAAAQLAAELQVLSVQLEQHLVEEEQQILPLVEKHLTVTEWAALGQHGLAGMGKDKALMTLGAILEEATAPEQAHFLGTVPLSGRIAWHLLGRRRYRNLVRRRREG